MPKESGLQKRGTEGIRNLFGGPAVGPWQAVLAIVTKGKRKRRQAEVERAMHDGKQSISFRESRTSL